MMGQDKEEKKEGADADSTGLARMLAGLSTSSSNSNRFPSTIQSGDHSESQLMISSVPNYFGVGGSDQGTVRVAKEGYGYAYGQKIFGAGGNNRAMIERLTNLAVRLNTHKAGHAASIEELEKRLAEGMAEEGYYIIDDELARQLRSMATNLANELKKNKASHAAKVEDIEMRIREQIKELSFAITGSDAHCQSSSAPGSGSTSAPTTIADSDDWIMVDK